MERISFTPTLVIDVPHIPGLTIRRINIDELADVRVMNRSIFAEDRIINTFDRPDLVILEARVEGVAAGFKIGYRENRFTFYSAKGGIMPAFRRRGIALALLENMMTQARAMDYRRFAFDTFPNLHPGMTILALKSGFRLIKSDYNTVYREYRLRFEARLEAFPDAP